MMKRTLLGAAVAATLIIPPTAATADSTDMADVKRMIEQMKADYEQRIQQLEQRLEQAEANTAKAQETAQKAAQQPSATEPKPAKGLGAITSGNAFNPQISVILDGNYYHDNQDGAGTEMLGAVDGIGHAHGHDHDDGHGHAHGGADQGFNFSSAELAVSATVDPYFDAMAMLAIDGDGEVDLEEAWFQTRGLPHGFKIKGGKFLSDIGYINNQHPHQWDFTDQNLAYLNLLGAHGLQETGLQVTWLPAWDYYTLFGLEVLQGDQEKLGTGVEIDDALAHELEEEGLDLGLGERDDGPRLLTAFTKFSPDLGYNHALQIGLWGAWTDQHQELHGELAHEEEHDHTPLHALDGDAWMWGLDAVYKYDAGRSHGAGNFKLQGEYLWQRKDLHLTFHEENPTLVGAERKFTEDAFYLQGIYGIAPRWQLGLRYDKVGLTNKLESGGSLLRDWDASDRWTAAVTWTPTEFSRLRLQYATADLSLEGQRRDLDYVYLQFLMSLGSHGAHKF
jgi:outer membrane receptor protein involved in Fe transport